MRGGIEGGGWGQSSAICQMEKVCFQWDHVSLFFNLLTSLLFSDIVSWSFKTITVMLV